VGIAEFLFVALLGCHAAQDESGGIAAVDQGIGAIHPIGDIVIIDLEGVAFVDLGRFIRAVGDDTFVVAANFFDVCEPDVFVAAAGCSESYFDHVQLFVVLAAGEGAVKPGETESRFGDGQVHLRVVTGRVVHVRVVRLRHFLCGLKF